MARYRIPNTKKTIYTDSNGRVVRWSSFVQDIVERNGDFPIREISGTVSVSALGHWKFHETDKSDEVDDRWQQVLDSLEKMPNWPEKIPEIIDDNQY